MQAVNEAGWTAVCTGADTYDREEDEDGSDVQPKPKKRKSSAKTDDNGAEKKARKPGKPVRWLNNT